MPSFPGSIFNPTTKTANQTIQSAHINDVQAEIVAIETGYLTGTARLNSSHSTVVALSVLGGSTISSGLTVGGTLSVSGASTFAGGVHLVDQVLTRPEIKDYAETRQTPTIGSTTTFDFEQGNVGELTLTQNTTLAFTNPPASGKCGSLLLILKQDATGGRTVSWPASVKWPGGSAPTMTSGANKVDVYVLTTTDGGTTYYGTIYGQGF